MSGVKHTPGPWVAERSVEEWGVSVIASNETGHISNPTRGQVCHVSVVAGASGDDPELAVANARLIASAPDLLEALIALVDRDLTYHGPCIVIPAKNHGDAISIVRRARNAIARARGEQSPDPSDTGAQP
ncbi:hypothetical protein D1604_12530 [Brevundimonas sp. LPMIX5]|uniref:hypothetical protein n=1 Tax=Brevundimonas sp. LPMIX5 TaxID=2305887 RepID=UPI000E669F9D|nr:hypothetical protein [Brevundimonas sp. LPMIX5]RIJ65139.1 hypothetical protein D1604_12530 [Brevundimonas sp. LPMIX5]